MEQVTEKTLDFGIDFCTFLNKNIKTNKIKLMQK